MVKITANVEGMACGMCEAHVNDAIRKAFSVKSVKSDHVKKITEIISEEPLDEEKIKEVIGATGYTVTGVSSEPYKKKGLFGF